MWSRYDGDVVKEELEVLAAHGCTLTRSFCYWPDFMPEPDTLDDEVMERFVDFLELHRQAGLWTVPTFIVGHMSGENWDPAWRAGRDLYRDVWFVSQQAWFVAEVARRTASHPAIAAWLLSNEMPLYGRNGDEEAVTAWTRLLVHALRAGGATQPVGTGDGAWGIEVTGNDNGFSLRRIAPIVDFIGPHVYPSSNDAVRQMLAAAFSCELCDAFGKPVVLEEFGLSSDMASGENAAHYYRQVLHSSLLAGRAGGSRGTTVISTTWPARTRTATIPSKCTSASPITLGARSRKPTSWRGSLALWRNCRPPGGTVPPVRLPFWCLSISSTQSPPGRRCTEQTCVPTFSSPT